MTTQTQILPDDLKTDLMRNREGRLSSRQWIQLITEPLTTLLLLSVPLIILFGRFGIAGRWIVLLVIAGIAITAGIRAIRFARAKLHYRVLYAEKTHSRWKFWRKITLVTKMGEPLQFDSHVTTKLNLQPNQAMIVYYIDVADRRAIVSVLPQKHPQANLAQPTTAFKSRGGQVHDD